MLLVLLQQELSLRCGDRLVVFGEPDVDGFYYGELEGGRRGYVPADCLQPGTAAGPAASSRTASSSSDRRSSSRSAAAAASTAGHRAAAVGDQTAHSASAPPSTTRHRYDESSRTTTRRHNADAPPTTTGRSSSATMPRDRGARVPDLTATGAVAADSSTRHRRQ